MVPEMTDGIKCVSKLRVGYSRDRDLTSLSPKAEQPQRETYGIITTGTATATR